MVKQISRFDVTYLTIDSIQEGVGSSQILPLLKQLSLAGLKVHLISFEKIQPSDELFLSVSRMGISWHQIDFGREGVFGGIIRFLKLVRYIPSSKIIHARSDIPAAAAILSRKGPVIWDVRSLWTDQRRFLEKNFVKRNLLQIGRVFEKISASKSVAMSTLTLSVVPILRNRHKTLPFYQIVVPTSVDTSRFELSPKMPVKIQGLYSGTYNEYYDLDLSRRFTRELQRIEEVEIHWARPSESRIRSLDVGESFSFSASQMDMQSIIPLYSFGFSICKLNSGESLSAAMPTKIAEFLACGRPVVINAGLGDYAGFIEEYQAGVVLDGTQIDLVNKARAFSAILKDPNTPVRCRAVVEKYLGLESGVIKYLDLYSQIDVSLKGKI